MEVEIDTETGQVRVLRVVSAEDVGKANTPVKRLKQILPLENNNTNGRTVFAHSVVWQS